MLANIKRIPTHARGLLINCGGSCCILCLCLVLLTHTTAGEPAVNFKDISFLTSDEISFVADQWSLGWPNGKTEKHALHISKWLLKPHTDAAKRRIEPLSVQVLTFCKSGTKPTGVVQNVETFKDSTGAYDGVFCWLRISDFRGTTRIDVTGVLRLVDEPQNLNTVVCVQRRFTLHNGKWTELDFSFRIIAQ